MDSKDTQQEQAKPQHNEEDENQIRVSTRGGIQGCISIGAQLLLREENAFDDITIRGAGAAISRVCQIAQILRFRIPGLHLVSVINSIEIEESEQDKIRNRRRREQREEKEGKKEDETPRKKRLVIMQVQLSKTGEGMDTNNIGYQEPLPKEETEPLSLEKLTERRQRREGGGNYQGRGGRGGDRRGGRGGDRRGGYNNRRGGDRRRGGRGRRGGYRGGDRRRNNDDRDNRRGGDRRRRRRSPSSNSSSGSDQEYRRNNRRRQGGGHRGGDRRRGGGYNGGDRRNDRNRENREYDNRY